ncbi:MAG: Gfo/Idh/MocA family protein [Blastocatellia bacterium]
MNRPLKTAVIGTGHLGREHARVHASLGEIELVAVCDTNHAAGQAIAEKYQTRFVEDYRELLGEIEAVSIATPTISHHEIACACLEAGIHALVEKPISHSVAAADEMISLARDRGLVLQVGHIERFNPAFQALRTRVTKPFFFEAHRLGVFTPRSLDIDVVMDLMVHELDIILSLVHSEVVKLDAVGIPILTPKIDLANARLEFANGCVANITASRVAGERMRKLRMFQPGEYYSLDYAEQSVARCQLIPPSGTATRPEIVAGALDITRREPLLAEIESFATAVRNREVPAVTGADGRRALALATEVLARIQEHSGRAGIGLAW